MEDCLLKVLPLTDEVIEILKTSLSQRLTFQTPFVRLWHGQTHHLKLLFKSNLILSCHFLIRSRVTIKVLASRARAVDDLINALHSTIVNYDFRVVLTANL